MSGCEKCGGTGFVSTTRLVSIEGRPAQPYDYSTRCHCMPPIQREVAPKRGKTASWPAKGDNWQDRVSE